MECHLVRTYFQIWIFADDIALLAELLKLHIPALEMMAEAISLGLKVN